MFSDSHHKSANPQANSLNNQLNSSLNNQLNNQLHNNENSYPQKAKYETFKPKMDDFLFGGLGISIFIFANSFWTKTFGLVICLLLMTFCRKINKSRKLKELNKQVLKK